MAENLPEFKFIPLSAALSWIAFGEWTDTTSYWDDYSRAKQQLEDALTKFLEKAVADVVSVRGKLMSDADANPAASDTDEIPAVRFHDFRQFDQTCCGLRVGVGLWGFADENENSFDYVHQPLGRQDFYRDVRVCRDDLIEVFPSPVGGRKVSYEDVVQWCRNWIEGGRGTDGNKAWKEFSILPEFAGFSREDVFRPAWKKAKTKKQQ